MSGLTVAKVAVENTAYRFDKAFDYSIPEELLDRAEPGCRVMVPFGTANAKRQGMILALETQEQGNSIKPILAVLDRAPLLSTEGILLVSWLKEHYFCTLFEAAKLLFPVGINLKMKTFFSLARAADEIDRESLGEDERRIVAFLAAQKGPVEREKLLKALALSPDSEAPDGLCRKKLLVKNVGAVRRVLDATQKMVRFLEPEPMPKLTPRQKSVYRILRDAGSASLKELCYFSGATPSVVRALAVKGAAQFYEEERYRNPYESVSRAAECEEIVLSEQQQNAYEDLLRRYCAGTGTVSLLYGVTGSGKTSVFMRLIDRVHADGRGVIVMVPEISLTPQTIALFHRRYGRSVAVFHSGLTLAERMDEWKRVNSGEASIAVGTRSAVFAPFRDLGLIIVDEEQEYTYKSESSPRYHAREVAGFRCRYHKALLVLSSATPSLESFYYAQTGRYGLNILPERYGDAKLPEVTVVDMNREAEQGNVAVVSVELLRALEENLQNSRQSIVLLNRRGYNTFASCKACGHVMTCPNCSISLTYHTANHRLMCHYCGYSVPFTKECPNCHEERVHYSGSGTQRAEQQLQELLPGARILRLDTDAAMTRFSYEKKLRLFAKGEYDIIVGTQMVAKGLDFENVTLVGVLSADQALYGSDFRSYERAFDLITQVVGRAGRGKFPGRAVIQTFTPENNIIRLAAQQNYRQFYNDEILIRKTMLYPPFSDICMVGFVGTAEEKVREAGNEFLGMLSRLAQSDYCDQPLRVFRPSPALIGRVSNKYRYKLIMKCRSSRRFREMISRLLIQFSQEKKFSGVTLFADINPDTVM